MQQRSASGVRDAREVYDARDVEVADVADVRVREPRAVRVARVARVAQRGFAALQQLAGGFGTALLALLVMLGVVLTALACLVRGGLLAVPPVLRAVRAAADLERERLGQWGPEVVPPGPAPERLREAAADRALRRELTWLLWHATAGLLLGLAGVLLPALAVRDLLFPLYWRAAPPGSTSTSVGWGTAHEWGDTVAPLVLGLVWVAAIVWLSPGAARLQAAPARRLLAPPPGTDLTLRVAQLAATRAAALDAHAVELRRIERALHDGTQNRVVAVTVLLGAARRALERDPTRADVVLGPLLEQAHGAAEQALEELRGVARGILPPVLADRGLAGALTGLAAASPVPTRVDVDVPGRCPASVEATAYSVVAEALTGAARRGGAAQVVVTAHRRGERLHLRVVDDGSGEAQEGGGPGLAGVRRRVEAHDGTLVVTSPPGGPTTVAVELPCGS
ncbi:sensor histidine kinase [Quadrisphaera sp. DSM 44207]|uniref:sensor histidine kinase n=1 Tax=Quadrisphaera sp. DSM 44207 TaxID=1881057 RepID=UPI00350F9D48